MAVAREPPVDIERWRSFFYLGPTLSFFEMHVVTVATKHPLKIIYNFSLKKVAYYLLDEILAWTPVSNAPRHCSCPQPCWRQSCCSSLAEGSGDESSHSTVSTINIPKRNKSIPLLRRNRNKRTQLFPCPILWRLGKGCFLLSYILI